jgi:hypothetical protein
MVPWLMVNKPLDRMAKMGIAHQYSFNNSIVVIFIEGSFFWCKKYKIFTPSCFKNN